MSKFLLFIFVIAKISTEGEGVKCYQCQSTKGDDFCGAYEKFEKENHVAIDCNSDESNVPGTFCMKITQQGPRGFIWDGRWRQVIRRCASVSDTGVTGGCIWGVRENGVFWEECYCIEDNCNRSQTIKPTIILQLILFYVFTS